MSSAEKAGRVVKEIRARASQGRPLNSGATRGDWLYAAAVYCFGSWGAAVQAAGFDYEDIHQRKPMSSDDVLEEIRRMAQRDEPLLARSNPRLTGWSKRFFGSWASAVRQAGYEPQGNRKWTAESFAETLRPELAAGHPMGSLAVIRRMGEGVYKAGCKLYGSWQHAVEAARCQLVAQAPAGRRGKTKRRVE